MSHYHHLTIKERETLLEKRAEGKGINQTAREMGRSPSTISRELRRNRNHIKKYSPSTAQSKYYKRRQVKDCRKLNLNKELYQLVKHLFLDMQWSPEQISNRLKKEDYPVSISYNTIYRAIYSGMFDEGKPKKRSSVIMRLRHRGKRRKGNNHKETRGGRANQEPSISKRPEAAQARKEIGHWEGDTINGRLNTGSILTLADRKSRYLLAEKLDHGSAEEAAEATSHLIGSMDASKRRTLTFDKGREFIYVDKMRKGAKIDIYFAHPHSPWERPTNENTNGLLREYVPKKSDFRTVTQEDLQIFTYKLNCRPKKCLEWKTPMEVFFDKVLHFT